MYFISQINLLELNCILHKYVYNICTKFRGVASHVRWCGPQETSSDGGYKIFSVKTANYTLHVTVLEMSIEHFFI